MEFKKIKLRYKGEELFLNLEFAKYFQRIGLMFSRREKANALLFEFSRPTSASIHSLFVSFDFIAIWMDESGKILEVRIVRPWTFHVSPSKKFSKLIEIPVNKKYFDVFRLFVESSSKIQKI
jgi:uncharacterized membrane protein (UPF0127 family)